MPTRLHGVGQPAERIQHRPVVREELEQAGDDGDRRSRRQRGERGAVEGVALRDSHVVQLQFRRQPAHRRRHWLPCNRAGERGHGDVREAAHRIEQIAAGAGGDIEQPHRPAVDVRAADHVFEGSLQMHAPPANAGPADAVEVKPVDQLAQRGEALRPIRIHVVERQARIEARVPAEPDPPAEAASRLHDGLRHREHGTAGLLQTVVLRLRVPLPIGVEQRWQRGRLRKAILNEPAHLVGQDGAILVVKDRVIEAGQDVHFLQWRRQLLEELAPARRVSRPSRSRR